MEAYSAETPSTKLTGEKYPKMSESNLEVEDLLQTSELYKWNEMKPSVFCGFFKFVLQLTLLGCTGSFLFGFNISLLNTAVQVVCSEFQLCGYRSGFAQYVVETINNVGVDSGIGLCYSNEVLCTSAGCTLAEISDPDTHVYSVSDVTCKGGYNDVKCSKIKWYIAFLQTAVLLGGAIGASVAGNVLANGRRFTFLVTMLIFCVGVICSVCANSFPAMFWARLIVGVGVGFSSVVSPTYISEMTPKESRGKYGVLHQLFVTVGIFCGLIFGLALTDPSTKPLNWTPDAFTMFWWRFMLALGIVPVIIGGYFMLRIYTFETPTFYIESQRYQDAYHILERIYERQDVKAELDIGVENARLANELKAQKLTFFSAFKIPLYRRVILIGIALAGFQQFGGVNVFVTSSDSLFANAGLSKSMQTGMSVIMGAINVLMTFPTIVLIEKLGRKQLLFLGSLAQFIVVVPCAVSYWLEAAPENPSFVTQILSIIGVIGFMVFFAVAFGPVLWVYLFEIFPIEIKDVAASVCTSFNWISAVVMVFIANILPNQISFSIFAFLQLIATIFILIFLKETRGYAIGQSPYFPQGKQATNQQSVMV